MPADLYQPVPPPNRDINPGHDEGSVTGCFMLIIAFLIGFAVSSLLHMIF